MAYYPYFATQPADARAKFLSACEVSGLEPKPFRCPTSKSRDVSNLAAADDTAWWIDVVSAGPKDAENCLILGCGLSGQEGFCGSGIMVQWLQAGMHTQLPSNLRVILVHGVNPENLMLASESQVVQPAPEISQPPSWTNRVLAAAEKRFAEYARSHSGSDSEAQIRHASPNRWIESVYDNVADDILISTKRAALVEFHTGMHPEGELAIMSCHQAGSLPDRRAAAWFGEAAATMSDGPALADALLMNLGFRLRKLEFTACVASFGIYSTRSILELSPARSSEDRKVQTQKIFNPESDTWRRFVCTEADRIIERCAKELTAAN